MWVITTENFLVELDKQLGQKRKNKQLLTPQSLIKILLHNEEKFRGTYSIIIKFPSQIKNFLHVCMKA